MAETEFKDTDKVKVALGRTYSFGKEVTVSILTMDDEEAIGKQVENGVSQNKATIALATGLPIEDAGKLVSPDALKIITIINSFQ